MRCCVNARVNADVLLCVCSRSSQAHKLDASATRVLTQVAALPSATIGSEASDSASVVVSLATAPAQHRCAVLASCSAKGSVF